MKKTTLLLSSCILCALSNSALAAMDIRGERTSFYERNKPTPIGFNYTFIEGYFLHTSIDNDNSSSDDVIQSVGAKMSIKVHPNFSVNVKVAGSGYSFNNEIVKSLEAQAGVNYHHPLTKETDGYIEVNFLNIDVEDPDDSDNSSSASGNSITFGIRQRINRKMEWGINASSLKIEDEKNTRIHLDYSYGADNETQYVIGYESTDTDSKTAAFLFGVRFNY